MVTGVTYMLAREDIFSILDFPFETFIRFITKISEGYRKISYHNKTHGVDLSQVILNRLIFFRQFTTSQKSVVLVRNVIFLV
jgi:hypothetical protein